MEINIKLNDIVDPKLTEVGIQQAVKTANYLLTLNNIENYEIMTSRYSRTLQTVNELIKIHGECKVICMNIHHQKEKKVIFIKLKINHLKNLLNEL